MLATLLSLADSRLPAGGHAHSAGAEQAVADGLVRDAADLDLFLRRRLATSGAVTAGVAAAAARAVVTPDPHGDLAARLAALDEETDARMPVAATRAASRAQGRGLARVGRQAWPLPVWDLLPRAPHHPVALGVAAAAGGATAREAAVTAAYLSLTGPATAAQRLLGLDPVLVAAVLVRLGVDAHRTADEVAGLADGELPIDSDVLSDLLTARHTPREDKLFAS